MSQESGRRPEQPWWVRPDDQHPGDEEDEAVSRAPQRKVPHRILRFLEEDAVEEAQAQTETLQRLIGKFIAGLKTAAKQGAEAKLQDFVQQAIKLSSHLDIPHDAGANYRERLKGVLFIDDLVIATEKFMQEIAMKRKANVVYDVVTPMKVEKMKKLDDKRRHGEQLHREGKKMAK